ncbi:MAG TPA: DegT/DnrJ/EryC1/StrS family aminotransferase, partial [Phototrophicaceae bacterium]|nr:DegT/DnrJ/EryC1/StrS family aminotransferase [Phototrophicaceae bacterium]
LLRARTGRTHVVLTGRGATAIWATLRALDLHDQPILIPANTCYIVLWAILHSGNQPYLADIDPLTGNVTAQTLDQSGVRPAVIIPAHMYGIPAPLTAISAWARENGAFVMEDAALTVPTLTSASDATIYSFGREKIIDADGGGALVTDDARLAAEVERALADLPVWNDRLEKLNQQWLQLYWPLHLFEGETPRLSELYPTLFDLYGTITRARLRDWSNLRGALASLDASLALRRELADRYDRRFASTPVRRLMRPSNTVLWRYPILVPSDLRDHLLEFLWSEGVLGATRWYPSLQPMRRALASDLPTTPTPDADQFAAQIINLPLAPATTHADVDRAATFVLDAL